MTDAAWVDYPPKRLFGDTLARAEIESGKNRSPVAFQG